MFMAGKDIKLSSFKKRIKKISILALTNATIPFIVGISIGLIFQYSIIESLIIGIVFISSAVAVIIPSLESKNLVNTKLGKTIISTVVLEDITSLALLSIILQFTNPVNNLPVYLYIPALVFTLFMLKFVVPKLEKDFKSGRLGSKSFESELQFVLIVLLAIVVVFELLGIHSILAGFITGLMLSDSINRKIDHKIHAISYGVFIPVFFIMLGVEMNFQAILNPASIILILTIILALIVSKLFSGWLGGRLTGHNNQNSLIIGASTLPQLSSSLAAAYTANELNLISNEVMISFIILSIVTTLTTPLILNYALKKD